jgi:hypothetical protein
MELTPFEKVHNDIIDLKVDHLGRHGVEPTILGIGSDKLTRIIQTNLVGPFSGVIVAKSLVDGGIRV